jgi:hypothetical protein
VTGGQPGPLHRQALELQVNGERKEDSSLITATSDDRRDGRDVFWVDPEPGIAGPAIAVRKRNQAHHTPTVGHQPATSEATRCRRRNEPCWLFACAEEKGPWASRSGIRDAARAVDVHHCKVGHESRNKLVND